LIIDLIMVSVSIKPLHYLEKLRLAIFSQPLDQSVLD